ncbi:MAG: YbfB/YjiJ family MFS transporter, partial [Burkholderiaceae bacterium]|nr:YbfB/YjiJ family MFS transporter [Burkholderiaceae bacterium]
MDATTSRLAHLDNTNWLIVTIGIIALAVAMGIGRFAFTPLMPLMLRDATLTLVSSAEWAAANYFGYLIGALSAA